MSKNNMLSIGKNRCIPTTPPKIPTLTGGATISEGKIIGLVYFYDQRRGQIFIDRNGVAFACTQAAYHAPQNDYTQSHRQSCKNSKSSLKVGSMGGQSFSRQKKMERMESVEKPKENNKKCTNL